MNDALWLSKTDAQKFFGVSESWLVRGIRPMLAAEHIRREGKWRKLFFYGPAIHAALLERAKLQAQRQAVGADGDPMLVGAVDSPALERYRAARAQREELALERDRGLYIARDDVRRSYALAALPVRRFGEWLRRHVGKAAEDQFRRAIAQADRVVGRMANTSEVESHDIDGDEHS